MPRLYEYFLKDQGRTLLYSKGEARVTNSQTGEFIEVKARIHIDHEPNALYVAFFVPESAQIVRPERELLNYVKEVLSWPSDIQCDIGYLGSEKLSSTTCRFTGRVFIYTENKLSDDHKIEISRAGVELGYSVVIRDGLYSEARTRIEVPLAFISHDSRNKELFAEPLALALSTRMCPVWYDDYSLRIGASLRDSIEKGLKECKKCIFLLTPQFLANGGWAKREYDSIFTRELVEENNVILPVWAGVKKKDIYEYSPSLADRCAVIWPFNSKDSAGEVAAKLIKEIMP